MTVSVVNAWSGTFTQPASFGITPPALQSTVVALTVANSVGGGTGTPAAGNWLFCLAGWNQSGLTASTVADGDDTHSFWRPGDVTKSQWAVSPASGNTRTNIWYTANLARAPGDVYTAPNGAQAGRACLIVEVSGLGPWDTVTGVFGNYAAAATSLNLALGAPSASAFLIAAVTGDNTSAGQAFAPVGWTTLPSVTAGTSAVMTSAWITTSGSVSVNGTATSAEDLSGVIIGVLASAPSPITGGGVSPAWAGRTILEFAPGSGFHTPPDQMTWVTLNDSAAAPGTVKRLWAWADNAGIPYGLGQLQSGTGAVQLGNDDGYLSPSNVGSPYYSSALNSNMSFQSGVSPWTGNNGAALAQSSAHVFASSADAAPNYSLQLTPNGVTATPGANSEQVAISAAGTYSASAWVYIAAGYATGANLAINWYNSSHTYISTTTPAAVAIPAATWTQITNLAPSVPGTAAFAQIVPQLSGTPAASVVMWIAEAALVAGSSAVSTGLVTTGVPVRLRMALGTIKGTTYNRWYVISRNAAGWPEKRNKALRSYVETGLTDVWSVQSQSCPSPYRGEIRQDNPYAWWPMDDQPLAGGVQPTTLRNTAPGNTNVLTITQSAAASTQQFYSSGQGVIQTAVNPTSAIYSAAAQQGWMYGDPQSSPASYATSNTVTANPGAAAWQASQQAGIIGSAGWFLSVNDANFPVLAGGVTVECWFNYPFSGSGALTAAGGSTVLEQPACPLTILELATASAPVAILQLDVSGHLSLITYNGSTATSNSIYTGSDLRSNSWHHVALTTTTTAWTVYVDGGATATVSGSATGMTSAWTWLLANGDLGSGGGSSISNAAALVQSASAKSTTSVSSLTVNFANVTTAGNCLIVTVSTSGGTGATVTGITLGGAAGNFAVAKAVQNGTSVDCEIWADPNCAGGQSAVVVSFSGATICAAEAMEFSGIPTSTPVDKTASSSGNSTTFTSTATAVLAQSAEIAIGVAACGGTTTITGPASWGNFPTQDTTSFLHSIAGYLGVSSTAALTYAGAVNPANAWAAAIATIKTNGGLVHSGNMAASHLAVYPRVLPAWRIIAHYWSAITAFGQLPAPANTAVQWNDNTALPPDGSLGKGTFNGSQGIFASAVVAAVAGTVTSGPSAWATGATFSNPGTLWATWTGVAPSFNVYTAGAVGAETQAAVAVGQGDSFNYGFGGAAVGGGVSQTSNPVLVQSASNTSSTASILQVTFPAPTTAGNCLVFCVSTSGGTGATVSGITLTVGGSADNFAVAKAVQNLTSIDCEIWTDANCAGGQISFTVSLSGASNVTVQAMEWSGLTTSPVDQTASGTGSSTAFSSGATAALAQSSEVVIGITGVGAGSTTLTGPANWGNLPQRTVSTFLTALTSYVRVSATTAQTYAGTVNPTHAWAAAVVTLKTVSASIASPSPPASGTATGDTVQQRIERVFGYGSATTPMRCIDPAPLLVHAATDIGGQQAGANITNIAGSDSGLLSVDNQGAICYRQRTHLASDTAAWQLGPNTAGGQLAYAADITFGNDPQKVWTAIQVTPFSPDGATLAVIGPASAAAVNSAQVQYGARPYQVTSYLQSAAEQQAQANWLFQVYGALRRRVEVLTIDAAAQPAAWGLWAGVNVGDLAFVQDQPFGPPVTTGTYRITQVSRALSNGANGNPVQAQIRLVLDPEPSSYWA